MISVIIPTYNRRRLLTLTLQSLVYQTVAPSQFELIIVDDGSDDDSWQLIKQYQNELDIKYVYQKDKGFRAALARNRGIQIAKGELCVFIDSGVILSPSALEEYLDAHLQHNGRLAQIGYVFGFDNDNANEVALKELIVTLGLSGIFPKLEEDSRYVDIREPLYIKYQDELSHLPAPWVIFWTANVAVDRESLLNVGLFDESFVGWGGEDVELGYRLKGNDVSFYLNRAAKGFHYPHGKCYIEHLNTGTRNMAYFYEKHPSYAVKLLPSVPALLLNDILLNGVEK